MNKASVVDTVILQELLKDGRKSLEEISREHKIAQATVRKHFAQLKKKGVIVGATTQIDYNQFGLHAVGDLLINVESRKIDTIVEKLKIVPSVFPQKRYGNRYNVRAIVTLKDLRELDKTKEAIRHEASILDLKSFLWTDIRNMPENMIAHRSFGQKSTFESDSRNKEQIHLDELALKTVDKLSESGRKSFRAIAKELGCSTDTVIRKYQNMVSYGLLKVVVQLNPTKMGFCAIVDFSIGLIPPEDTAPIIERLMKIPNAVIVTKSSGEYDLRVAVMIRSIDDFFMVSDEIMQMPNISKIETAIRKAPTIWPRPRQYISTF